MSQKSSLTQSDHSVRQALTAYIVVREDFQVLQAGVIFWKLPITGAHTTAIAKRKKLVQITNSEPTNYFVRISLA